MMRALLITLSALFSFGGLGDLVHATTVLQQQVGFLELLVAAVLLVGAGIMHGLADLRLAAGKVPR